MTSSTGNVASDSPLTLQVTASDPDHDPLVFAWTSTCPGSFDRADLDQVTFIVGTLATGADCSFQVVVSDGHGGTAKGTLVLSAAVPVINIAPTMGIVYQSTDAADGGEVVLLHASATDPEGQPLTWTWKASDGAFSDQVDQVGFSDVRWTAPAIPGVGCTITATATDPGGASASFVFKVQVQGRGRIAGKVSRLSNRGPVPPHYIEGRATAARRYGWLAGVSEKLKDDCRFDAALVALTVTTRLLAAFSAPSGAVQVAAVAKAGSSPSETGSPATGAEPDEADQTKFNCPPAGSDAMAAKVTRLPPVATSRD